MGEGIRRRRTENAPKRCNGAIQWTLYFPGPKLSRPEEQCEIVLLRAAKGLQGIAVDWHRRLKSLLETATSVLNLAEGSEDQLSVIRLLRLRLAELCVLRRDGMGSTFRSGHVHERSFRRFFGET